MVTISTHEEVLMEKNYKILKIGMILIAISLIISIGVASYLRLDRPVFLKSYIERPMPLTDEEGRHNLNAQFIIRYITNADDARVVNHIEFEDYRDLYASATEYSHHGFQFFNDNNVQTPGQRVGRYRVRDVAVTVGVHNAEEKNEDISLTRAKVYFSDGHEEEEVDIGEWILYPDDRMNRPDHFQHMMSRGSSDGISIVQEKLKDNIELIKMESSLLNKYEDFLEISVGARDYRDIAGEKYETDGYLKMESVFKTPEDPELRMYDYDIKPRLHYRDSEGNSFIYRLYNLDYRKYGFEFLEIIKFLRARGEL